MSCKSYKPNSNGGFALVTVLFIMGLLAVVGVTLNRTGGLQSTISSNLKTGDEAYYIANAGFQHGLFMLKNDPGQRGVTSDVPFSIGSYSIKIADIVSPMGNIVIESEGKAGTATRSVEKIISMASTFTVYPTLIKDTLLTNRTGEKVNFGISTRIEIGLITKWQRGIFEYDLSIIPAGATIESAVFELYMYNRQRDKVDNNFIDVEVRRITRSWSEGIKDGQECSKGATEKKYNCKKDWDNMGGDYASNVETKTIVYYNDIYLWHQWDIKNLVQFWADYPGLNYGMLLKDEKEDEHIDSVFIGFFYSDEYFAPALRPVLTVIYSTP